MEPADREDYYVLMWNFLEPMFTGGAERADLAIRRFREIGCNGATFIASYVDHPGYHETYRRMGLGPLEHQLPPATDYRYRQNDLPFYVMNLCPAIYMKWEKGKPIFRAQYDAFDRDGDRRVFVRTPCINNPEVRAAAMERIDAVVAGLAPVRDLALLYDWRDESSVTAFILAADTCFCDHCLARMRRWLADRYGSLEELNAQWGTGFAAWDAVEPMTTMEALRRRAGATTGRELNFSAWADHRDFMNHTFTTFLRELKARIVAAGDPAALSGATGTQCPSVFGGYDFSLLAPIGDWAEAYDFGQSVDLFRSFKSRRDFRMVKTDFCKADPRQVEAMLWTYVFQGGGYSGTIIWESNMMLDVNSPALEPTVHGRGRAPVYTGLRSGLPRLLQLCDEVDSPVALHYSHASVNADFVTACPPRSRSVGAYEPERYPGFRCRAAWWKMLEDRGLRPVFVSSQQIEAGALIERGLRLLVLPRSIAVSDAEAAEIARFVEAGGIVVADSFAGRMDARCREREVGALDALFGVRRKDGDGYHHTAQRASLGWDAVAGPPPRWGKGEHRAECSLIEEAIEPTGESVVMGCAEYSDTPLGFRAGRGRGEAILFNAAPLEYLAARRGPGGGENFHGFFGHAFEWAGLTPLAEVLDARTGQRLAGWRVWAFTRDAARYFAIAPDLAISQDVLGALTADVADAPAGRAVRVRLSASGHLYEARTGRYFGLGAELEEKLDATAARVYAVLPYRVEAMKLGSRDGAVEAELRTTSPAGLHVLRFDVYDAAGSRLFDAGANVDAPGGRATWRPRRALPAGGSVVCRDVATGVSARMTVTE
ncbi:MAG: hypothetical protein BIFFINMI_03698 [Phycisphaerae bacterium]|nr:hypothetical protein [Phycisphaerae bacterium]